MKTAIKNGCRDAENLFFELSEGQHKKNGDLDKSGSCAIFVLIVENIAYVGNVGDSRAILSKNNGSHIIELSQDHRPDRDIEKERITKNGGHIYQTQSTAAVPDQNGIVRNQTIIGPLRVFPGGLSVSRTFGDIEAKMAKYGGNPKVVIAEPEIDMFEIDHSTDFFVLGCDGIYDKLTSQESVKCVWETFQYHRKASVHEQIGVGVEMILKKSAIKRSMDNITVVIVAFDGFAKLFDIPKTLIEPKTQAIPSRVPSTDQPRSEKSKSAKQRTLSEQVTKASQQDSEKEYSESSQNRRNQLSEDARPKKHATFTESQFQPLRRLNHSLRDAHFETPSKTPVLNKNSKIESISTKNENTMMSSFNEKGRHKKFNTFLVKSGTRNYSNFSPAQAEETDSLTNKFISRSINFNRSSKDRKNSDLKDSVR